MSKKEEQLNLIAAFGRMNYLSNFSRQLEDVLEKYPEEARMIIENSLIDNGKEGRTILKKQYQDILNDFEEKERS